MFDFFKEVIINSATLPIVEGVDASGNAFKRFYALTPTTKASDIGSDPAHYRAPKEGVFRVLRCADYVKSSIKDAKIYKTPGTKGSVANAVINFAGLPANGTYRLLVDISLTGQYYSDYKYPWSEFHKPIMVEFEVVNKNNASDIVAAAMKALKAAIPSDYKYVTMASPEAGKLKISCTDPYQVIKMVKVQQLIDDICTDGCSNVTYKDVDLTINIVKNKAPFATGEWLIHNLRFPSYPNLRYAGPNSDETPVNDATYTQFAFEYCIPRRGLHGQSAVGQTLASVTRHVFYVHDSIAAKFEQEIKKAFETDVEIVTIGAELAILNGGQEFSGPMVVTKAAVNGGTVALQATFSENGEDDGTNVTPVWTATGNFKPVEPAEGASNWTLANNGSAVDSGDMGTLTATYNGISTTVQILVQ